MALRRHISCRRRQFFTDRSFPLDQATWINRLSSITYHFSIQLNGGFRYFYSWLMMFLKTTGQTLTAYRENQIMLNRLLKTYRLTAYVLVRMLHRIDVPTCVFILAGARFDRRDPLRAPALPSFLLVGDIAAHAPGHGYRVGHSLHICIIVSGSAW